jgi:hypothetical protein
VGAELRVFSDTELAYPTKGKLGGLATIDSAEMTHVVPLGWHHNPGLDTIDIGCRDFTRRRKFPNLQRSPQAPQ